MTKASRSPDFNPALLTDHELVAAYTELVKDLAFLKCQLAAPVRGPNWKIRANRARILMGSKLQAVQAEQAYRATVRKRNRDFRESAFERQFLLAAKRLLPADTYVGLLNETQAAVAKLAPPLPRGDGRPQETAEPQTLAGY